MPKYTLTVGLEIHTELKTAAKMFCDSHNPLGHEDRPNTAICPVCMGHPGTLPTINRKAVEQVIQAGLALGCQISPQTYFERKNYFYPDLPKGYQISQYLHPLCAAGTLSIALDGYTKDIRITRIHLEEDTGKLTHPEGKDYSLVDYNRSSVPLMELVTEPDITTPDEAFAFAKSLQLIFRYLGIADADMENGQMRLEANISVSKTSKLGTKVEVKNLNSFAVLKKAIAYEFERQTELLERGGVVRQETRGWDDKKQKTFSQRIKEESMDYRYFPDPDLPHLVIRVTSDQTLPDTIDEADVIDAVALAQTLPELPRERSERLVREYGISTYEATLLTEDQNLGNLFSEMESEFIALAGTDAVQKHPQYIKTITSLVIGDIKKILNERELAGNTTPLNAEYLAHTVYLVETKKISLPMAKRIITLIDERDIDPETIMRDEKMELVADANALTAATRDVIAHHTKAVEDYRAGKMNAFEFLVGQIMRATRGQADIQSARDVLTRLLNEK